MNYAMKRELTPRPSTTDLFFNLPLSLLSPYTEWLPEIAEPTGQSWKPRVDISETKDEMHIEAELPGMDKDCIKLKVKGNTLELKGERIFEKKEEEKQYKRIERMYGSFTRIFPIPNEVEQSKIKAEFKNGILHIVIPKPVQSVEEGEDVPIK